MKPAGQGIVLGIVSVAVGVVYFLIQQQFIKLAAALVPDPVAVLGRSADPLFALMLWRQGQWLAVTLLAALLPAWVLSRVGGRWAVIETLGGAAAALGLFLGSTPLDAVSPFPAGYAITSAAILALCLPLEVYLFAGWRHGRS